MNKRNTKKEKAKKNKGFPYKKTIISKKQALEEIREDLPYSDEKSPENPPIKQKTTKEKRDKLT